MNDLKSLQEKYLDRYVSFIRELPIASAVKTRLLKKKNFEEDAAIYLYYPRLFNEAFDINEEDQNLWDLCISVLLCLQLKPTQQSDFRQSTQNGFDFLLKTKDDDGLWQAINFIRPKINESYRSKTITNALVLKAIIGFINNN